MAGTRRAVSPETLGAWLLKVDPAVSAVRELAREGFAPIAHRCVRPSYRTDLVRPGQPVLVWVSGHDPVVPAGLHAQGRTAGLPAASDDGTGRLDLPVALGPLRPPVPRAELLGHPVLRRLEVLRMPAGSNPSHLTREELDALRAGWPQVTVSHEPA